MKLARFRPAVKILGGFLLLAAGALRAAEPAATPAPAPVAPAVQREACFKEVMQELDMNGDVLAYLNGRDLFQNVMTKVGEIAKALPADEPETAKVQEYVKRADAFLGSSGLYAVRGMGFSVLPRADGQHTAKLFLAHDPAAASLPVWRILGGAPGTLKSLEILPADTTFAQAETMDLSEAWGFVRSGISQIGGPDALAALDRQLAQAKAGSGVDAAALLQALGGEIFVSVQLSETTQSAIPLDQNNKLVFPQPAMLLGASLRDAAKVTAMLDELAARNPEHPMFKKNVTGSGQTLYVLANPVPAPFPLQPALAVENGFLLIGSSPDALAAAFAVKAGGAGLTATPDFIKAFANMPRQINALSYIHPRFAQTVRDVQIQMAKQQTGGNPTATVLLTKWIEGAGLTQSAGVRVNKPNGLFVTSVSPVSGRKMVGMVAVAPVAILAGIALPNFVQARTTSQKNACINNLRQIDGAKEQWALANDKDEGVVPNWQDLLPYLRKQPVCAQGGKYSLNPLGKNPACSIRGHVLP